MGARSATLAIPVTALTTKSFAVDLGSNLRLHGNFGPHFANRLAVYLLLPIAPARTIVATLYLGLQLAPWALCFLRANWSHLRRLSALLSRLNLAAAFTGSAALDHLLDLCVTLLSFTPFFFFFVLRVRIRAERQCNPEA